MLYDCLIGPIEYLFKLIFYSFYHITLNSWISLLGLSFCVELLTQPLYRMAERLQDSERMKRRGMEAWEQRIKHTFHGDEKSFMLQAYYRLNRYNPAEALYAIVPLMLQIPFFVAAYSMLCSVPATFGKLFTESDQLLRFCGMTIHLLPIMMTGLNLCSAFVYSHGKGLRRKERLQMWILPLLFLLILYKCPAGVVLYWVFNNLFSLIRNLATFFKKEKLLSKVYGVIMYLVGLFLYSVAVYMGAYEDKMDSNDLLNSLVSVGIVLSWIVPTLVIYYLREKGKLKIEINTVKYGSVLLRLMLLFLFVSLYIPFGILADSPTEFPIQTVGEVFSFLGNTILSGIGVFIVWGTLLFCFLDKKARWVYEKVLTCLFLIFAADHFLWSNSFGTMTTAMRYEDKPVYGYRMVLTGILFFLILVAVFIGIITRFRRIENKAISILLGVVLTIVGVRLVSITAVLEKEEQIRNAENGNAVEEVFTLSTKGKNVIVIMLDRAIGAYVPFIMQECPELTEQLDGFVWYPNSVSFGGQTNLGTPGIFGGYEYTPAQMRERTEESMGSKHIEALKVMPVIFGTNGWKVQLADLPYADYLGTGSMEGFRELPNTQAYNLEARVNKEYFLASTNLYDSGKNMSGYCVYKIAPVFLQHFLYNEIGEERSTIPLELGFAKAYWVLNKLKEFTKIEETDTNHFIAFANLLTHEPRELQLPDYSYTPGNVADNAGMIPSYMDSGKHIMHLEWSNQIGSFHSNVCAFKQLGAWFSYLKEQGVYDNTRIILVSDHGFGNGMFEEFMVNEELDAQQFNCLLMVKDFGASGFTVCDDFMTNADTVYLATENMVPEAINPFSGKAITWVDPDKKVAELPISPFNGLTEDSFYYEVDDESWYRVSGDIYNKNNWIRIEK